ncbi:MarR family winged helix-turn-helix transcriptional regulator [Pseudonocardia sp. HH130630-07]|uniref:MarR family winged helix-turn-helix transcriptional regulator n=1 Tax=Pseudonocardia sp. HH130630-07 TaxID=1690815 RepID=UPI0008152E61|nr:MarR family transcriptional regulator [Pseudonocardia sp. HH130630-07]ANY05860.1 MarR family transcriptional regulator [Pseudonocardia sp. HH130630-07]
MSEPTGDRTDDSRAVSVAELTRAAYRLSAADARLRGRATRRDEALSLTHARTLKVLAEHGPMTVGELAGHVETSAAAVTQLVHGLTTAGFVTRERTAAGDRRTSMVTLTGAGLHRHRERETALAARLGELLADLDGGSIDVAAAVLTRLAALYDEL